MCGTKSCAILGHSPMRFAWGFDEEAVECHDMKMELAQQIMVLRQQGVTHFPWPATTAWGFTPPNSLTFCATMIRN